MTRIKSDYDQAANKDALIDEIEARRKEGRDMGDVTATSKREELEAALALDDEAGASQPPSPLPKLKSNLPQGKPSNLPEVDSGSPKDEDYKGVYRKDDGEDYALAVRENNTGETHFAKNTAHSWSGTAQQFKEQFTKP